MSKLRGLLRSRAFFFILGALSVAVLVLALAPYVLIDQRGVRVSGEVSLQPQIHVRTPEEVTATRSALIQYVFATPSLPESLPEVQPDGMIVRMPNGLTSKISSSTPEKPNGGLVVYHAGHEGTTGRDRSAIERFVQAGYVVWKLDLPLKGDNPREVVLDLPGVGRVPIRKHQQFPHLKSVTPGHPIRYFLEPVFAAVNLAVARGYRNIFMAGLSGGGWTTVLAAAMDPRITASYPIAGGVPLGLRFDRFAKNEGDWEESLPEIHQIASFEDLSIMGAAGRSQLQVLNEHDLCCYNEPRYLTYVPAMRQAAEALGGRFDVHWSEGELWHRANPAALDRIVADMSALNKKP